MKTPRARCVLLLTAALFLASCALLDQARLTYEEDGIGLTIPLPVPPPSEPADPAEPTVANELFKALTPESTESTDFPVMRLQWPIWWDWF